MAASGLVDSVLGNLAIWVVLFAFTTLLSALSLIQLSKIKRLKLRPDSRRSLAASALVFVPSILIGVFSVLVGWLFSDMMAGWAVGIIVVLFICAAKISIHAGIISYIYQMKAEKSILPGTAWTLAYGAVLVISQGLLLGY